METADGTHPLGASRPPCSVTPWRAAACVPWPAGVRTRRRAPPPDRFLRGRSGAGAPGCSSGFEVGTDRRSAPPGSA